MQALPIGNRLNLYIQEIVEVVSTFPSVAKDLGVKANTIELITQRLSQAWQENEGLLAS
ncbi:hypothetical protein [Halomonas sp. 'Soap Lake |uniref:hypothetical protein n=1 Tax=Halomonas sp. 'Soap Lake \